MHESSSTKGLAFQMWWQQIVSPGTLGLSENPVSIAFLFSQLFTFPFSPPFSPAPSSPSKAILPLWMNYSLLESISSEIKLTFSRGLREIFLISCQLSLKRVSTIERRAGRGYSWWNSRNSVCAWICAKVNLVFQFSQQVFTTALPLVIGIAGGGVSAGGAFLRSAAHPRPGQTCATSEQTRATTPVRCQTRLPGPALWSPTRADKDSIYVWHGL